MSAGRRTVLTRCDTWYNINVDINVDICRKGRGVPTYDLDVEGATVAYGLQARQRTGLR